MKNYIDKYKNYIIAVALGLAIILFAGTAGTEKCANPDNEKNFINVMSHVKGVGEIKLITNKSEDGKVKGVVIVADGASDLKIKEEITDAAVAAFGVLPHQVQVFENKQNEGDLK